MIIKRRLKLFRAKAIILKSVSVTDGSSNNWHSNFRKLLIFKQKQIKSNFVSLTNEKWS